MLTEEPKSDNENTEAKPLLPACPYCGTDPMLVTWREFVMEPYIGGVMFCGNAQCRKTFNVQILGPSPKALQEQQRRMTEQVIAHGQERILPGIIRPDFRTFGRS